MKIFTFSSLSEPEAKFWLWVSDKVLLLSAALVIIGLAGEYPDTEWWKKTVWYRVAKWAVIFGIVLELAGDGGVFQAGDRVTEIQDKKIVELESQRTLSESQKARIASVSGLHKLPFVMWTNPETEAWNLALEIGATLQANGWTWQPCPTGGLQAITGLPSECTTLGDHIEVDAPPDQLPVAEALSNAIREPDRYGMDRVWPDEHAKPKTMTIMVGSKQ